MKPSIFTNLCFNFGRTFLDKQVSGWEGGSSLIGFIDKDWRLDSSQEGIHLNGMNSFTLEHPTDLFGPHPSIKYGVEYNINIVGSEPRFGEPEGVLLFKEESLSPILRLRIDLNRGRVSCAQRETSRIPSYFIGGDFSTFNPGEIVKYSPTKAIETFFRTIKKDYIVKPRTL
jgi:hypothetical protein